MSIQSEISRIAGNIASAYTALSAKGATMPSVQNTANLKSTIESIEMMTAEAMSIETIRRICYVPSDFERNYTQLEYIQSSGTQYIDTGYKLTSEKLRVVAEFVHTKSESSVCLFASESKIGTYSITTWLTGSAVNYAAGSSGVALVGSNYAVGTKYLLDVTADNGTITKILNGTAKTGTYSGNLDRTLSTFIFGMNANGTGSYKSSFKLYSFKIYDNGTMVRDFVPCKNASGVFGLYDIVNEQFYANAGSGSFTGA